MDHDLELIQSYPGTIWKFDFYTFPYPGNTENLAVFSIFPHPGNIGNLFFSIFCDFYKEDVRRNFTQNAPTDEPRSLI